MGNKQVIYPVDNNRNAIKTSTTVLGNRSNMNRFQSFRVVLSFMMHMVTVNSYIGLNKENPKTALEMPRQNTEKLRPRVHDSIRTIIYIEDDTRYDEQESWIPLCGVEDTMDGDHFEAGSIALPMAVLSTDYPCLATMSPLEAWCLEHLDRWYSQSQAVKCPFLRRRMGDILDNVEIIMKHTVIRRQCWPLLGPPQALRPPGLNKKLQGIKYTGISLEDLRTFIWNDWKPETGKGYYITGKLTTACYRDDCLFLGPDPDMPIRGLRKYVGVAAHLFDVDQSRATLFSLDIDNNATLVAKWQLGGILRLPWRPSLPIMSGTTVYHVDDDGLIMKHEEFWDISVLHAFVFTLFPDIANRIWKGN